MKKKLIIGSLVIGAGAGLYFLNNYLKEQKEKKRQASTSPNEFYTEPVNYLTYCGCGKSH